jgi:hypothetical protein
MAKQNGKEIELKERRYRVLQAKIAGASVRQIAQQEGVSPASIQKDVNRSLGELAREHVGHADVIRAVQMERYNRLLLTYWQRALNGDVDATKIAITIMDKISSINGVIPDKSMIQVNSYNVSSEPVTFVIEGANDGNNNLPTPKTVLEARAGDIQP